MDSTYRGVDLQAEADMGVTMSDLAEAMDVKLDTLKAASKRRGITYNTLQDRTLRDAIDDMKPADAVEHLLWLVGELAPCLDVEKHAVDGLGIHLTRFERLVLATLMDADGRLVSRDHLMAVLYADRASGDVPELKIVDIFICKVRKKIKDLPFTIHNVWGRGYRLVNDER